MEAMNRVQLAGAFVAATLVFVGCSKPPPPCRATAGDDIATGARTGAAGAETGARTGLEGVKTAGKAVGGFVSGGSAGAEKAWNEGKEDTREQARKGSGKVNENATVPRCER